MKITEIEKLNQLISRTDMSGNEKVEWLTDFIDKHVIEQLTIPVVVRQSEQLFCCCDNPKAFKEMEQGKERCSKCEKPY